MVDIHYPSIEMVCGSKISCVTWSSFHKSTLASSDYDCTVVVWDASTAQKMRMYQVSFSTSNPEKANFVNLLQAS